MRPSLIWGGKGREQGGKKDELWKRLEMGARHLRGGRFKTKKGKVRSDETEELIELIKGSKKYRLCLASKERKNNSGCCAVGHLRGLRKKGCSSRGENFPHR